MSAKGSTRVQSPTEQFKNRDWRSKFGPGLLISASFIGPGTVTTATVTGASYGFTLAWAIVFSIIATIVLQEMSVRIGLATQAGLGEALRTVFQSRVVRAVMMVLVVAAIGVGGAAYAGGDTVGTALALSTVTGVDTSLVVLAVMAVILLVLVTGSYKVIERFLVILVGILALTFVITTVVVRPNFLDFLQGVFVPTVPDGAQLTAIALIGTSVVPYNIFLHASLVQEKWGNDPVETSIKEARVDNVVSISLGGFITLAILTTATGSLYVNGLRAESGADMARALEPLLGETLAQWMFAIGLFSAGLTSAVAGPLGAAFAITGTIGSRVDMKSWVFRGIALAVVLVGGAIALSGFDDIQIIIVAQAANGLLLPVIAGFLLYTMNNKELLGKYRNGVFANVLGGIVFLVVLGLGIYQLMSIDYAAFLGN